MSEAQKKAECERICGEGGKRGDHRIAPELCPIKLDEWHNPKKKAYA